jgi:hypothetical protein
MAASDPIANGLQEAGLFPAFLLSPDRCTLIVPDRLLVVSRRPLVL